MNYILVERIRLLTEFLTILLEHDATSFTIDHLTQLCKFEPSFCFVFVAWELPIKRYHS